MRDADAVVELESAGAAPVFVDAAVLGRRRDIECRWFTRGQCKQRRTQAFSRGCAIDNDLPRLRVAPGSRALREPKNLLDDLARNRVCAKASAAETFVQQGLEHTWDICSWQA